MRRHAHVSAGQAARGERTDQRIGVHRFQDAPRRARRLAIQQRQNLKQQRDGIPLPRDRVFRQQIAEARIHAQRAQHAHALAADIDSGNAHFGVSILQIRGIQPARQIQRRFAGRTQQTRIHGICFFQRQPFARGGVAFHQFSQFAAPHCNFQRAPVFRIRHERGGDAVQLFARRFIDFLFLPILRAAFG